MDASEEIKDEVSFPIYQDAFKNLLSEVKDCGIELYLKNIDLSSDIEKELNDYDNIVKNCQEDEKIGKGKEKAESSCRYYYLFHLAIRNGSEIFGAAHLAETFAPS